LAETIGISSKAGGGTGEGELGPLGLPPSLRYLDEDASSACEVLGRTASLVVFRGAVGCAPGVVGHIDRSKAFMPGFIIAAVLRRRGSAGGNRGDGSGGGMFLVAPVCRAWSSISEAERLLGMRSGS
jgi:hypothetical protein